MRTVIFTKDFANRKAGDKFPCDSMLASQLVRVDKVAVYEEDYKPPSKKKKSK